MANDGSARASSGWGMAAVWTRTSSGRGRSGRSPTVRVERFVMDWTPRTHGTMYRGAAVAVDMPSGSVSGRAHLAPGSH